MFSHSNSNSIRMRRNKTVKRNDFQNHHSNLRKESPSKAKLCGILSEFCSRSTIHGVKHFVVQQRHWIERAWWIVAVVVSTAICAVSIYKVWSTWQNNPIIVDTDTKSLPIKEIPFPAVTICPFSVFASNKFNFTAVYRLLRKLDGVNNSRDLTAAELKIMKLVKQFCFEHQSPSVTDEFVDEYLKDDDNIWNTINAIAPAFNETFVLCKLFNKWIDCKKLFVPQITGRGLCYTFNTLNANEMFTDKVSSEIRNLATNQPPSSNWNQHTGYFDQHIGNPSYPYHVHDTGPRSGLTVVFKVLKDDLDYLCSGCSQGFAASVHPPNEVPQMYKRFFYVPLQETVLIAVEPILFNTSESVLAHNANVRKCFVDSDRQLQFYKQYTMQNCRAECLSNFTLAQCGCVQFSMPRSNGTKICGPAKVSCYNQTDSAHFQIEEMARSCDCLPSCTMYLYNAESSQTDYNIQRSSSYSRSDCKRKLNMTNALFSRLIVKFNEDKVIIYKKIDSYTFTSFCTKIGGICSLFVGASLISFVELLYYATLRLFFIYHRN